MMHYRIWYSGRDLGHFNYLIYCWVVEPVKRPHILYAHQMCLMENVNLQSNDCGKRTRKR